MALFVKVYTSVPRQPKFIEAGATASWLWLAGICYCRDGATDGFIPKRIVPTLVPDLKGAYRLASRLVTVRLWDDALGGYRVHDYLAENPSRDEIEQMRAGDRERKRKGLPGGFPLEGGHDSNGRLRAGATRGSRAGAGSPSGTGAGSEEFSEESARETELAEPTDGVEPVWSRRGGGALVRAGGLIGDHRRCDPAAAEACARGKCVPGKLIGEWRAQCGDDVQAADAEIRAVVRSTLALVGPGPIGDDSFAFWNAGWSARHGSQAPARALAGKGNASRDAMQRTLQRRADGAKS